MKVILFQWGDFTIRSYGVLVATAFLLAVGVAHFLAKGTKYREHIYELVFYIVVGSLLGARIWEVIFFQSEYYSEHLSQILAIWNGGLSIQGGLIGGFLAGALFTRKKQLSFWEFADILAPAIIFGQGVGRIACLLNGDAFGSPTGSNFGLVFPEGTIAYATYGSQPLWPVEVWEGQWDFIIFGLLLILKNRRWPKGFIFLAYNFLYSLGRFLLEFLRGDTPRYLFDWTAAQWTSMAVIIVCLGLSVYFYLKSKQKPVNFSV